MNAATSATAGKSAGTSQPDGKTETTLALDQIQGNLVGFNKDFQTFLFLRFPEGGQVAVRAWLSDVIGHVATCTEVLAFNNLFRLLKSRRGDHEGTIKATWLNIAFTFAGLELLAKGLETLGARDLARFPENFRRGMRHWACDLGDVGRSAPECWIFPKDRGAIHALILLAADSQADLDAEAGYQIAALSAAGIQLLYKQDGATRKDQPGHEHFGFKDGVSQPRITGISDPGEDQGGPAPVAAGEFVLGYPPRAATPSGAAGALTGSADEPLSILLMNGSYLVFRRLAQDIGAFRTFVHQEAAKLQISEELLMAKLVGRYRSGAALAEFASSVGGSAKTGVLGQSSDPGFDPEHSNDFGYRYDPDGLVVPRAAHIRKVNPRDQEIPGEDAVRKRRILRRGIPFGLPYQAGASSAKEDRGLLFICYQSSIAEQFEFVQEHWANNPTFPPVGQGNRPGYDPIIGHSKDKHENERRGFDLPASPRGPVNPLPQWVTMTGGDYFFSPSINALCLLVGNSGKECDPVTRQVFAKRVLYPSGQAEVQRTSAAQAQKGVQQLTSYSGQVVEINDAGSGLCTVLITVGIGDLAPFITAGEGMWRARWAVLVENVPVWTSHGHDDELCVTTQGILVGRAEISVRQILKALPRDMTIGQILDASDPNGNQDRDRASLNDYLDPATSYRQGLRLEVYLDQGTTLSLPIDMSITPW